MVTEGAKVLKTKIQEKGRAYGVHRTGVTLESMRIGKPKHSGDATSATVSFSGSRGDRKTATRNAEVAMINNCGKKGQKARPFVTDGTAAAEGEANQAAEKIYDDYLKSKNLI